MFNYFDNASSSYPKAPNITDFTGLVNPSKGAYDMSFDTARIVFKTRKKLANLFGLKDIRRVIFTSGATHSINIVLNGLLKPNDIVVMTNYEHNAVLRTLNHLKTKLNLEIRIIPCESDLSLDLKAAKDMLKGAKLLISTHVNNVCGKMTNVDELSELAKINKAFFMLDAAQSVGTIAMNDIMNKVDFLCFSAHKGLLSLSGLGGLLINDEFDTNLLEPLIYGGTSSFSDSEEIPEFLPDKYEAGSLNYHAIASLFHSIDYIEQIGIENIYKKNLELREYFLANAKGIIIHDIKNSINNVSILFKNIDISKAADRLNKDYKICVRSGLHCSILTHKLLGTFSKGGSIRIAFGVHNNLDETKYLIKALEEISNG